MFSNGKCISFLKISNPNKFSNPKISTIIPNFGFPRNTNKIPFSSRCRYFITHQMLIGKQTYKGNCSCLKSTLLKKITAHSSRSNQEKHPGYEANLIKYHEFELNNSFRTQLISKVQTFPIRRRFPSKKSMIPNKLSKKPMPRSRPPKYF